MVAAPISPGRPEERTALASAIRLGVRVVGRVHDALVLLAEHDGGQDRFEYEWSANAGRLIWAERDVALWVPSQQDSAPALVQVAATCKDAAAVASLRWGAGTTV